MAQIPEPQFIHCWRQGTENPYLGFLALADAVVVTGDSMNMCSEACANGGSRLYLLAARPGQRQARPVAQLAVCAGLRPTLGRRPHALAPRAAQCGGGGGAGDP